MQVLDSSSVDRHLDMLFIMLFSYSIYCICSEVCFRDPFKNFGLSNFSFFKSQFVLNNWA